MQNYAFEMIQAIALVISKYIFKKNEIFIEKEVTCYINHRYGRILASKFTFFKI
jgi:hypothetical protein